MESKNNNSNNNYRLHKKIGNKINEQFPKQIFPDYEVMLSIDCGGEQKISLFCTTEKEDHAKYCDIDFCRL